MYLNLYVHTSIYICVSLCVCVYLLLMNLDRRGNFSPAASEVFLALVSAVRGATPVFKVGALAGTPCSKDFLMAEEA